MTIDHEYEARVQELEREGLTRSDAQGVADAERMPETKAPALETLHNGRYRADFDPENVRGALLVITRPRGGGVMVWNEAAAEWADHIRTAIDGGEADALCRAILAE